MSFENQPITIETIAESEGALPAIEVFCGDEGYTAITLNWDSSKLDPAGVDLTPEQVDRLIFTLRKARRIAEVMRPVGYLPVC
ncbi:hypothetical protein [Corynebacterium sp. HMSC077B05]|uniref:hypothetical protein n=1 Tax=Corynebacterium sp. HMSC077B05 TaxID=1739252 RepID=UPI0008A15549|nr:hypothetical protein [Corynebacterium sp. HMSC077B05]OFL77026.1 hypothetical protein HMPREF2748_05600 [Corynebacterium sp. HMSC077B05]